MRHLIVSPILLALMSCQPSTTVAAAPQNPIRTCFEPEDDCIALVVEELAKAHDEVLVQSYAFTNRRIVRGLLDAERRGVPVRMIIDVSGEHAPRVAGVREAGVDVVTDDQVSLQHNKIIIVDRRILITGSQNFTRASETHAENMLVIEDPTTVNAYVANWERRAHASRPYRSQTPN